MLFKVEEAEVKIAEVSGEEVDNKLRIDILKKEEQLIAVEKEERRLKQEEDLIRKEVRNSYPIYVHPLSLICIVLIRQF